MPPFPVETDSEACSMELGFLDDPRLADEDKQLISDWVEAGSPEGDPATAVDAPMHAPRELEDYDVELPIQEDFLVDGDRDIYRCFRIPLSLQQDVWLTGMQILPGNDAVVHHVLVWTDPDDSSAGQAGADGSYGCSGFPDIFPTELAGAWAPGGQPPEFPQGTGMPLSAGSSLVMNIHYHPTGTSTERDRTRIRLRWDEQPPEHEAKFSLLDLPFGSMLQEGPADEGWLPEFKIPAGATAHTETSEAFLPPLLNGDMQIFTVGPHMHYLGTEMLVTLDRGNQGEQCLLHTPDFRFDWQSAFAYDPSTGDLPLWRAGDNVRVQCTYNNSGTNPYLPLHLEARGVDAPQDVGWGEETGDEMCMAIVGLILP
ncbi:MAG TPA: hypothetical protein ENK18_08280 [Deltaproteobacteria bacterium]|nr:hypothetical protein [Deltaproteobacteria bacterium]